MSRTIFVKTLVATALITLGAAVPASAQEQGTVGVIDSQLVEWSPLTQASASVDNGLEVQGVSYNAGCTDCGGANKASCKDCGSCFIWADNAFVKVGVGLRASVNSFSNAAPNGGRSTDIEIDNMRIYLSGQGHDYITFEFNTEIFTNTLGPFAIPDEARLRVLDAVVKFGDGDRLNLWMGRFLPPSDRANLDGPYYLNAWTFPFVQNFPAIFAGRDDGVAVWGQQGGGAFKWQVGVFDGVNGGAIISDSADATSTASNPSDSLLLAGRVVLNLLDPEPGYYNASTYYGEKEILALGFSVMHQNDVSFSSDGIGDFTGWNIDLLWEHQTDSGGVVTLESAYYEYNDAGVANDATSSVRQGESWFVLGSYLIPREFCFMNMTGKLSPYIRYQEYDRRFGVAATAVNTGSLLRAPLFDRGIDVGIHYIMFGHNARITAVYQARGVDGVAGEVNGVVVGAQLQF